MTQKHLKAGSPFPPVKPNLLRLYSMRFCPNSQRTRIVLAHKNIPHEIINIDTTNKPDWILTKNPQGTVPILELGDKIVYESTAACEWLDDVYPQSRLQTSDPYQKALDRMLLEYFTKIAAAFYGLLFNQGDADKQFGELAAHLKYYNEELTKRGGPFYGGKAPTMIDVYLFPFLERLKALGTRDKRVCIDKSGFPKLAEWFEVMGKIPAIKATANDTKILLHVFDSVRAGKPDLDYGLE